MERADPNDVLIGLMDATATIMEVLLALGIQPSVLAEPLEFQRDAHRAAGRPDAAAMLDHLRDLVLDPERQRQREMIQLLHRGPPEGSG